MVIGKPEEVSNFLKDNQLNLTNLRDGDISLLCINIIK